MRLLNNITINGSNVEEIIKEVKDELRHHQVFDSFSEIETFFFSNFGKDYIFEGESQSIIRKVTGEDEYGFWEDIFTVTITEYYQDAGSVDYAYLLKVEQI